MNAQQTNVEVIANNIANINTTGFKRSRAEFTDLLYQAERVAGAPARGGQEAIPEGAQIGLGTRTVAVRNLHMQGSLTNTGNKLDLALTNVNDHTVSILLGKYFLEAALPASSTAQAGQRATALVPALD